MAQNSIHIFSPSFCKSGVWVQPHWVVYSGLHPCVRVSVGAVVSTEAKLGGIEFQAPAGCWQNTSFDCQTEMTYLLSCWLSAGGSSQIVGTACSFLLSGFSSAIPQHGGLLPSSWRGSFSLQLVRQSYSHGSDTPSPLPYNLIKGAASHHFCHIVFWLEGHRSPPQHTHMDSHGVGITQG